MVESTYANVLQGKAGCLTENAITKQAPPRLTRDETSDIEETSDESIRMHSEDLPPKKQKHQVQKHEHHGNCGSHSQSKEQVNYPQVASAQGEKLTRPSVAASNEKKKQQENSLDKSVRPKTNQSASSVGAVAATSAHQKQQQHPEQLQECIRTLSAKKKKKKKKKKKNNTVEKESPPQLKSNKSGGNVEKEQNQMLPEKMQNDVKSKKSSVTSACGPANPREQTGPSKSPLSLGVPVGKEKNQLKVKVQNDVKPKESRGIGASGPAKTKEQPKQSNSLLSSKEKEKGKMSQQGVQNDAKRKNNSAPKTKTKEQSNSSKNPCPKDTVKKEQNTLPQQKTQSGVKPKKSSVTSDKTSAKTSKQNSSSKSCPSPGATNKKGQSQMPQPKVQNDKKAEKSSVTSASGPAKAKDQPSRQDKHQQKQQENSEVINAVKAESKKKTESSQKFSDKPTCVAKTQEQNSSSKSCPSPGATNKKGQNQMPQPKVQNDKKAEKSSVTSASGPAKAKEQPSRQDKRQQKQQENSEVINAVKAESKKKTESSQKFSDKPTCVAKTQEQNSSSKSCPSPGATNKKGQNQMPQPKVQNDKKAEISSEKGAFGLADTKDQASSSKNSHTPREDVKKEQSQKSQNDVESKKHIVTPSSVPVKAKEQPFKQDKRQQKQQKNSEVNDAVNAESKKTKEPSQKLSDKPALKTEKEHIKSEMNHHRQRPTLFEKRESDASTSIISFTEQKDFPKNDQVLSNKITKPKGKLNQEPNAEKEDMLIQLFQDAEDMLEQVFQDAEDWGADFMTSLAHTPQQQQQNTHVQQQHHQTHQQQQQNTHVQQQHHQTHQQQQQNTDDQQQHHQTPQKQQQNTNVQQQHHQTHQQQQQNTNVQQQHHQTHQQQNTNVQQVYHQTHQQQQQNTNVWQQYNQTHQQKQQNTHVSQKYHQTDQHQQQITNVQQQYHQTHQQQQQNPQWQQQHHQTHLKQQQNTNVRQQYHQTHQQQQQNTNVQQQYQIYQQQQQNTHVQQQHHQTHQQQQNTNVQQQYYQIHQQQQQITNVPNLAPGIIPQIPMGLMLQAQTLPPQQVTFVQWEQQQWVKTSPETKLSTSPQWMKPMVLQFKEGNNPVFIHPLSEQASIPINPCLITDEQDEEFDDLLLSDVIKFVEAFPASIQLALQQLSQESSSYSFIQLAEVVLDVGRKPRARLLANIQGEVIGITAKVEHPLPGCLSPLYDIFNKGKSILVVGPTGVGKTTLLREAARVLSDVEKKNVMIIDTLSEIAGEGDIPHQSIGSARRLQVIESNLQHKVMSEAYQNHRPEIVIIDEISSLEEAEKTLHVKLRGIQLIAGVQGKTLADVLLNTALTPITGGIKESVGYPGGVPGRLRTGPVVFDVLVEMLDMERWIIHWDFQWAIDAVLPGGRRTLEVEERKVVKLGGDPDGGLGGQQVLAMRMSSTYKIYTQ
ncbi:myb-like protein Q isoform X2 [Strongylocentrotus purpuratus]|uniref:AAA+ ATPase domain-containing protein n=1 Tax=Strongylocentrotus purpuratus TaxID=7668 RepID=A0A7M7MYE0_STRPU|nr:myb-like protein Q isoform X2 [Strongylocentrotus purpuratus]